MAQTLPSTLNPPVFEKPRVGLNLWDFGGQDIYHGSHTLLLHGQTIFLVLWTPCAGAAKNLPGRRTLFTFTLPPTSLPTRLPPRLCRNTCFAAHRTNSMRFASLSSLASSRKSGRFFLPSMSRGKREDRIELGQSRPRRVRVRSLRSGIRPTNRRSRLSTRPTATNARRGSKAQTCPPAVSFVGASGI
jgi:hypothetical protein